MDAKTIMFQRPCFSCIYFCIFGECSCSTWDEDGHVMRPCFHSIDELEKLKEYPSPDMSFDVDYVNSDTGKYSYTISASTNNNIITFFIDNKKC